MRTSIVGGWVVGFDAAAGAHFLLENGVVVVDGERIVEVGRERSGPVEREIDARGKLVSPGFINTHAHAGIEVMTGLQDLPSERGPAWVGAAEDCLTGPLPFCLTEEQIRTHMEFGLVRLLKTGCTTVVDVIGSSSPWWLGNTPRDVEVFVETAGRLGARVYSTPGYRSLRSAMRSDGTPTYVPREARGFADLERAVRFIERHHGSYGGRVTGMLYPHAVDNTTPDLLRATREAANALGVGIQIHAAQSVREVDTTLERYGRTPIELLADTGVLGSDTILGHCIYINSHSMIDRPGDDLGLLAESGTSVAHSPLKFVYTGVVMESFQRYHDRGVNMTIGTDAYPADYPLEMRVAALAGKLIERNGSAVSTADLYNAATLGGARALGRDDIGRIAPGARADIVIIDLNDIDVGPIYDPIRALVHYSTARDVETVMIDGRIVVDAHRTVGVDEERLMAEARPVYDRLRGVLAERNWNRPTLPEMFPHALPVGRA